MATLFHKRYEINENTWAAMKDHECFGTSFIIDINVSEPRKLPKPLRDNWAENEYYYDTVYNYSYALRYKESDMAYYEDIFTWNLTEFPYIHPLAVIRNLWGEHVNNPKTGLGIINLSEIIATCVATIPEGIDLSELDQELEQYVNEFYSIDDNKKRGGK